MNITYFIKCISQKNNICKIYKEIEVELALKKNNIWN